MTGRALAMRRFADYANRHGRRFVWWQHMPVFRPRWWLWTVELGYAIAAVMVADRCARDGNLVAFPAQLYI